MSEDDVADARPDQPTARHRAPDEEPERSDGQAAVLTENPPDPDDASDLPLRMGAGVRRRLRHRWRRLLVAVGVIALTLALVAAGGAWYLVESYEGNVTRLGDVFAELDDQSRPAPPVPEAVEDPDDPPLTFLLVGSDTREEIPDGGVPGDRSDLIMLVRFTADRDRAQVISIPRDSWVDIPGYGLAKMNAAYAHGGPRLLIQTLEQVIDVRIDHFAAINFDGLIQLTDDLGGVDVLVAETTRNGPYTFTAGLNRLDGVQARYYVAQRKNLPGGDFDRVKRQQQYLRSMFTKLAEQNVLSSPLLFNTVLTTVTRSLAVDNSLSTGEMVSLGLSLNRLTPDSVDFFTAPVLGTGTEGRQSVVYLDDERGGLMWDYLASDSLAAHVDEFPREALPAVPN